MWSSRISVKTRTALALVSRSVSWILLPHHATGLHCQAMWDPLGSILFSSASNACWRWSLQKVWYCPERGVPSPIGFAVSDQTTHVHSLSSIYRGVSCPKDFRSRWNVVGFMAGVPDKTQKQALMVTDLKIRGVVGWWRVKTTIYYYTCKLFVNGFYMFVYFCFDQPGLWYCMTCVLMAFGCRKVVGYGFPKRWSAAFTRGTIDMRHWLLDYLESILRKVRSCLETRTNPDNNVAQFQHLLFKSLIVWDFESAGLFLGSLDSQGLADS
jgi:hypothetical protein